MGTYSDKVPPPPGVTVAARQMMIDENYEPQYGERVPYVIIRGEPNSRLVNRAVGPHELLENNQNHLDGAYYISRVLIPPLERIFSLVGADVRSWYEEMPKTFKADQPGANPSTPSKDQLERNLNRFKIEEHFPSSACLICGALSDGICDMCRSNPQVTITSLLWRIQAGETRLLDAQRTCSSCTASGPMDDIKCESLDCPWLFERKRCQYKVESLDLMQECVAGLANSLASDISDEG